MKMGVKKIGICVLGFIMAFSLLSACGGVGLGAGTARSSVGHEYASESDPMGAFLAKIEEQLRAASDTTGISWDRSEITRREVAYSGEIVGEDTESGYLVLYKDGPDGEEPLLMAGGDWAPESERIVNVYVQFTNQETEAAADQLKAVIYSDAVADGLGEAYEDCKDAKEIRPGVQSGDTATLFIQSESAYSSLQFYGLREQGDILYFLDGDEAVVWGFWLDNGEDKLPDEIIPEELGGCPVTRVNLLARVTDDEGFIGLSHGSYIAVPSTAETVCIQSSVTGAYFIPEQVKSLYFTALMAQTGAGVTIVSAGRETQVEIYGGEIGDDGTGPSIQAYYCSDLANLAEENDWEITYLDTFDGSWAETEKLAEKRLDQLLEQYKAADPEKYNGMMEEFTRDEMIEELFKENWEDIILEDPGLDKEDFLVYQHVKVGDYMPLTDPDKLTAEAEAYEGYLGPEPLTSGTCGEDLTWELDGSVLTVSGTGEMYNYSAHQGFNYAPWHLSMEYITKVVIGDGVASIGETAFMGCTALTEVTIPGSVKNVGGLAFSGCTSLSDLTIQDGVEVIGDRAFSQCSFTEVTLPASVVTVLRPFRDCEKLKDVTIESATCTIYDEEDGLGEPGSVTIHGYTGSTAEAFAQKWGYTIQQMGGAPAPSAPETDSAQAAAPQPAAAQSSKKLLEVDMYDPNGSLREEFRYEYDENGVLGRCVYYYYGDTTSQTVYTYTFDEEGRLLNKHLRAVDAAWTDAPYETDVFVRSYNADGTLAVSKYSGAADMWTVEEYGYDENGLMIREEAWLDLNGMGEKNGSTVYNYENAVDAQGNLTSVRSREGVPSENVVYTYDPNGRLLQGYDDYWATPVTYTYTDIPCFCVRDEVETIDNGSWSETSNMRTLFVLDSAGKEVDSFSLGSVDEVQMNYGEDGYLQSAIRTYVGSREEIRFTYGDPSESPIQSEDVAAAAPVQSVDVTAAPSDESAEQPAPTPNESGVLTVTANEVNVRTGPGTEYESLGKVNEGTRLTYTGKSGSWYQIEYNGAVAYIIEDYIVTDGGYYVQMLSGTLSVNGTDVNVRTGPGIGYDSLGKVSYGTTLTVTGKSDNWYQVVYNGAEAYIIEDYVIMN